MLKEFQGFIAKGNVMDMAVGIIIGVAFAAIVKSMVGDLINPLIGLFFLGGGRRQLWLARARESLMSEALVPPQHPHLVQPGWVVAMNPLRVNALVPPLVKCTGTIMSKALQGPQDLPPPHPAWAQRHTPGNRRCCSQGQA